MADTEARRPWYERDPSIAYLEMLYDVAKAGGAAANATVNGAYALGLGKTHGTLEQGRQADLVLFDCPDYRELAYWFGANLVKAVWKKGRLVHGKP